MNYFELFELPIAPVVDRSGISKKYFELQKKFHPDFFTNETEADKENALEQSAAINKGFNIFSNKEKTIEYFLQLNGVITADEKYHLPPDFLMEMMDLNEAIDEKDAAIQTKIDEFENGLDADIADLISVERSAVLDENDLKKLKAYYYKKKYLKRILDRLDD
ncbi:MAG: Fe-S protein assembly co-chaperone HscB [Ferruginibacter sp.]